eukprot:1318559-Pyramimonas_sp.AAC.1
MAPAAAPSTYFEDVGPRTTGSQRRTTSTTISTTAAYSQCLAEQGLEMADKTAVISANMDMTNET